MKFKSGGPLFSVFIHRGIADVYPFLLGEDIAVWTEKATPLRRRYLFVRRRNGHGQEQYLGPVMYLIWGLWPATNVAGGADSNRRPSGLASAKQRAHIRQRARPRDRGEPRRGCTSRLRRSPVRGSATSDSHPWMSGIFLCDSLP